MGHNESGGHRVIIGVIKKSDRRLDIEKVQIFQIYLSYFFAKSANILKINIKWAKLFTHIVQN